MSWLEDTAIRSLTGALEGLQARTQAVASNLSNVDTPGYQPVNVDFESELARQLSDAGISVASDGSVSTATTSSSAPAVSAVQLARTAPGHLAAADVSSSGTGTTQDTYLASYRNDRNAVDVDESMTTLAETQLKYGAATRLLSGKLGMLRDVISSTGGR
jgi:flagellar basal-body rod protein FlgB